MAATDEIRPMQYLDLEKDSVLLKSPINSETYSQSLTSLIIENSHMGIFILNENFLCIYANNEVAKILGYPIGEIIGGNFKKHLHKDCRDNVIDMFIRRQKGESLPKRYEAEFIRKEGEYSIAEIAVEVMRTIDNEIVTIVQAFDITEKKLLEIELKKSEKKYHAFFENVLDFIFTHDLSGNIIESNARYVTEIGGRPDIIATSNLIDFMPEKFKSEFTDYLARIINKRRDEGVIAIQIPGGEIRILEYKNFLMYNDNKQPTGVMGSARDITEHIRDKKALRDSKERYQMILENVGDYIFELDILGNYTFVNEALVKKSGYSREKLIGANYREYTLSEELENIKKYHYQIFKTGKTGKRMQHRVVCKDRTIVNIELVVSLIKDCDGNPEGFRGVARDITERTLAEKNLLNMHEALEEKVDERTCEINEVNITLGVLLKKRERDKKKFEDKIAYNIKEVLTPYIELLKSTELDKHQKVYLEILEDNFKEISSPFMARLSENIQKLTRTEIQIVNFIKQNKISKEIADIMGISSRTVETHRDNIRKKLGIKNKKVNLRAYLLELQ